MIKNVLTTLLILGAGTYGLKAQDETPPTYFGIFAPVSQGDLKLYLGGKSAGHGFEVGYDWTKPEDIFGLRAYANFMRWVGDYSERLDVQQGMKAWRFGLDFSFNTPWPYLRPYLGGALTYWDGERYTASAVLGQKAEYTHPTTGIKYPAPVGGILLPDKYEDRKAKLGLRLGVDFKVYREWHVSLDYNHSAWRSVRPQDDILYGLRSQNAVPGYNPVNPSWVSVTAKYHFSWF